MPTALLFDLDGTLVHSVPDLCAALNTLLTEDARRSLSEEEVTRMVGNGVRKLVERGYTATGGLPDGAEALDALVDRFMAVYDTAPAALSHPYDGVPGALERLRAAGHRLAVCTNKPVSAARHMLDALDLSHYFDAVIGGGSTPELKPHPAPVFAALDALGVTPADALFIGDSPNDTEAARAAGLPVICVTFGYRRCSLEDLGADALVEHFAALPDAIVNFLASRQPAG